MNTGKRMKLTGNESNNQRIVWLSLLILFCVSIGFPSVAQKKKFPANVTPMLGLPYSVYLSDYSTPGSTHLSANILFNDFNEPQWNFRLKIKIESTQLRIETIADYRPTEPITLAPGVAKVLSGSDWEEYFNYNNLMVSGISVDELVASGGRLPEGFYSFCFQVLDYYTGDPLSEQTCQTAWLKLSNPPRINLPVNGNSLDPQQTQHPMSWQLFDATSPNATQQTQYQVTLWELTEKGINIQTAVANGQALQIFQSELLNTPAYQYSLSDPPLELGKQYVFRVQAIDPGGRDRFKNQGYSEFSTFYYGWPIGGQVKLLFPEPNGGFRKKDIPKVQWTSLDYQLPGQLISYEIKIAPVTKGQSNEQALLVNTPWFYYNTPQGVTTYNRSMEIDKSLEVMTQYAWQVKAFTNQIEVGKSGISHFNGPSLMENFWAGTHRIAVDYIDGTNLDDISGGGRIRLKPDAEAWTAIRFEHIRLKDTGDIYIMTGGEIYYSPSEPVSIELKADLAQNGKVYFDLSRFRINTEGLFVEGNVRWPLPFATVSSTLATVKSNKQWSNYNNFTINTIAQVAPGNQFKLLDPMNFGLNLSTSGMFYINNNRCVFDFIGTVDLPDKIKGAQPGLVQFPFKSANQLFYLEQDSLVSNSTIAALNKSKLHLVTKKYILDLSEQQSPEKIQSDLRWKGIYLQDFDVALNKSLDGNGQFDVTEPVQTNLTLSSASSTEAWIGSNGLNLKADISYPDSTALYFQTFPSSLRQLRLEINANEVTSSGSYLKGDFVLPVFSTERTIPFSIPINNLGFQEGYLEGLTGTKYTFNEGGGDQEIKLTVKRAVLSAHEKIAMTLDLEWPSMGVTLADLRGFNAWGDYSIGFDNKNGTVPLTQRYNASLSGYPITIGVIGAASNDGSYVFATTADAGLGDDVSGGQSVPSINVYSISANNYVPKQASGQAGVKTTTQIPFEQAAASTTQSFTTLQQNLSQQVAANQEELVEEADALKNSLSTSNSKYYTTEELVQADSSSYPSEIGYGADAKPEGKFNSRQQEIIHEIAAGFVEEMAKPVIQPLKNKTDSLSLAIETAVNKLVNDELAVVNTKISTLITSMSEKIATALKNDKVDIANPIRDMGRATAERITEEISAALKKSTKDNITDPINVLLKEKITGRVNKYITEKGTQIVFSAITGDKANTEEAMKQVVAGVPGLLKEIMKDVADFVSKENIKSTITATATGFIKNINMNEVGHDLRKTGEEILKKAINEEVGKVVNNLAAKYADDLGLGGFGLGGENPIDFVGVAQRFSKDGIKGVFNVDRVRVKLKTPVIDLDGFMSYTPKHPVYGDVWLGDIDMTIKVPKKFAFNAIYFNGRKDGISYWFCQITPPGSENTPYQLGKPLPKAAKPLKDPVDIGIAKIVGASGRLYHHMSENASGIVPDAQMAYGAYMHFIFFDKNSSGQNLRLEVSGEINAKENGDYTIAFDGNLQIRSKTPKILEIDAAAVVQGTVLIRYNSAEEHFFGYAKVVVNAAGKLCAQASLLVDVKPGHWRVAIGSREERIIFVPGCVGWSPTGWLDLNESVAELGLGLQYSGTAGFGADLGFVDVGIDVNAGFAFGIQAVVQYNPSFLLMRAGVWVDIWANVVAHYKFPLSGTKYITLVDIFIRGDLMMTFNPPPTMLEGTLNGRVRILFFDVNFAAKMKKQLG